MTYVVALDGDHNALETLFRRRRADNVLALRTNLAKPSPAQGLAGVERRALDRRGTPDLVLALALIHHLVITENVPIRIVLRWLHALGAMLVIDVARWATYHGTINLPEHRACLPGSKY